MWYFKSHFYALLKWGFSISSQVGFVVGHILEHVEYYAAWIRLFLVRCNQSPTEENQIWQVWNKEFNPVTDIIRHSQRLIQYREKHRKAAQIRKKMLINTHIHRHKELTSLVNVQLSSVWHPQGSSTQYYLSNTICISFLMSTYHYKFPMCKQSLVIEGVVCWRYNSHSCPLWQTRVKIKQTRSDLIDFYFLYLWMDVTASPSIQLLC